VCIYFAFLFTLLFYTSLFLLHYVLKLQSSLLRLCVFLPVGADVSEEPAASIICIERSEYWYCRFLRNIGKPAYRRIFIFKVDTSEDGGSRFRRNVCTYLHFSMFSAEESQCIRGSRFRQNVGTNLPKCTGPYRRKPRSSYYLLY
jgi:hypothetical protein